MPDQFAAIFQSMDLQRVGEAVETGLEICADERYGSGDQAVLDGRGALFLAQAGKDVFMATPLMRAASREPAGSRSENGSATGRAIAVPAADAPVGRQSCPDAC